MYKLLPIGCTLILGVYCSTGFEMHVAVAILRLKEGLDCSEIVGDIDQLIPQPPSKKVKEKIKKTDTLVVPGNKLNSSQLLNS